jgi:hypothetical protein
MPLRPSFATRDFTFVVGGAVLGSPRHAPAAPAPQTMAQHDVADDAS